MIQATIGFIVFGVHKDGLKDPMGTPFIDDALVRRAKSALVAAGLKVIEHDVVVASKEEARVAFRKMKCVDAVDAVVLFSGTWVWAAQMVGAIRDYCASGKGLLLWTHPDSQGWRPDCSRINSPTIRVTRYRNGLQCRLPPSINFDTNS